MEELLTTYTEFVTISEEDKKNIEEDRKVIGEYYEQDNTNRKAE